MNKQIRSDTLKKLAMLFMLIDHIGAIVIEKIYITTIDAQKAQILFDVNQVMRAVGRLAMPIFCYQMAVGLIRTRSRLKHIYLLAVAAILSEVPFDLGSSGVIFAPSYQNVIFTLLLGTISLILIEWFSNSDLYKSIDSEIVKKIAYALFTTLSVFSMSAIAELAHTDYGAKGVILIWIFYFFMNDRLKMSTYGIVLFLIEMAFITYLRTHSINEVMKYCNFEAYACLSFPLIAMDNGERRGGNVLKWFGYAFYPVHQLVLYLIAMALT